jgi:hypothetical protein
MNDLEMSPEAMRAKERFGQLRQAHVYFPHSEVLTLLANIGVEDSHISGMLTAHVISPKPQGKTRIYSPDNVRDAFLAMNRRIALLERRPTVLWNEVASEIRRLARQSDELFFGTEEGQVLVAKMSKQLDSEDKV